MLVVGHSTYFGWLTEGLRITFFWIVYVLSLTFGFKLAIVSMSLLMDTVFYRENNCRFTFWYVRKAVIWNGTLKLGKTSAILEITIVLHAINNRLTSKIGNRFTKNAIVLHLKN